MEISLRMAVVAATLLMGSACMYTPKDGESIDLTESQPFTGYTGQPDSPVQLQAYSHQSSSWIPIAGTNTNKEPVWIDPDNVSWYSWAGLVNLPRDPQFWEMNWRNNGVGNYRAISIRIRPWDLQQNGPLRTFAVGADQCVNEHLNGSDTGIGTALACSSGETVTLESKCGLARQAPCMAINVPESEYCLISSSKIVNGICDCDLDEDGHCIIVLP